MRCLRERMSYDLGDLVQVETVDLYFASLQFRNKEQKTTVRMFWPECKADAGWNLESHVRWFFDLCSEEGERRVQAMISPSIMSEIQNHRTRAMITLNQIKQD